MDYGRAFRVARALAGITQCELARRAKLSPSQISLVESGGRAPSTPALEAVSSALGLPLHLLTLLGAEHKDLVGVAEDEMHRVAQSIAELLLSSVSESGQ